MATRAAIESARCHGGVGTLLERQRLLVGRKRLLLPERHLVRLGQQHPRVGVLGEALGRILRSGDGAPAILDGASQAHEGRVRLREDGRDDTPEPEPPIRASRSVAPAGGRPPHGEAHQG